MSIGNLTAEWWGWRCGARLKRDRFNLMSSRDLVSITIVTYNSGRFIRKCLEAALGQKYAHLEIIVVDNGSTDGTVDLLEDFEERCLVIYNNDNVGFAAAQNQAIAASRGDWVLTLNPDVFLLPGFDRMRVIVVPIVDMRELPSPERTEAGTRDDISVVVDATVWRQVVDAR